MQHISGIQFINGTIGAVLVLLAFLMRDETLIATMFAVGAVLALISLKHWRNRVATWTFAVFTTGAMFFYFAQFFGHAPDLPTDWYAGSEVVRPMGLLVGAFTMIPVLSEFSCQNKADPACQQARDVAGRARKRAIHAFVRRVQERPTP